MKRILLAILLVSFSLTIAAQDATGKFKKTVKIWIHSQNGQMQKGLLGGRTGDSLLFYSGSNRDYRKQASPAYLHIGCVNISMIKAKKRFGFLEGALVGGSIGFVPIFIGEAGGFVAVVTFPLGIVTGVTAGVLSKKKYKINGNPAAFQKCTDKLMKRLTR